MSRLIDRAVSASADIMSKVWCIEVPEWGDEDGPQKIYVKTANLNERAEIQHAIESGAIAALADVLILRAHDADGQKLFKRADRVELCRSVDPDVIGRVVGEMVIDITDNVEKVIKDAEKN